MLFRFKALGNNYEDVVSEEEFSLLQDVLVSTNPDKYQLAREYIVSTGVTDAEVIGTNPDKYYSLKQRDPFSFCHLHIR